jgi:hypothetical protein
MQHTSDALQVPAEKFVALGDVRTVEQRIHDVAAAAEQSNFPMRQSNSLHRLEDCFLIGE